MDFGSLGSVRGPLASILVLTGLLGVANPSTAAELCTTGVAGITTSCDGASVLAQDLARRRVDRTLGSDPASDRTHRLNVTGSQPNGEITAPFAMSSDGDNTNFNTSLTQWGSAFSAADIETLKQAQTAIGGDTALPRIATGAPQFDLWAQGRSERFNETGGLAKTGSAFTTYVGADYRWHKDLLLGGLVQFDDSRLTILDAREAIDGTAYMAGPYLAYRLAPNVVLDAKAAWGTAHDSAITGVENISLASDRMLTEARLTGNWGWNTWELSQSGAITYLDEAGRGATPGGLATSIDVTRLSIGPQLKRRLDMSTGVSVEPFAFFKSSLDLADATWASPVGQNTVGGGVTLAKPDKYNIRAMADFTETMDRADQVATGKVSVSVPASLLGF